MCVASMYRGLFFPLAHLLRLPPPLDLCCTAPAALAPGTGGKKAEVCGLAGLTCVPVL